MKCPTCGFNSFESNSSCPKCAADLSELRQLHGLKAIVLPESLRKSMAASLASDESVSAEEQQAEDKLFSFELSPSLTDKPQEQPAADPFAFDDAPSAAPAAASPPPDPFADLLESTTQAPVQETESTPAPPQGYELSSFSWDDTPAPAGTSASPQTDGPPKEEDDFASLFGDLNDTKK